MKALYNRPHSPALHFNLLYSLGITWTFLFKDRSGRGVGEVLGLARTCLAVKVSVGVPGSDTIGRGVLSCTT